MSLFKSICYTCHNNITPPEGLYWGITRPSETPPPPSHCYSPGMETCHNNITPPEGLYWGTTRQSETPPSPPLTATHLAWKYVTTISHHLRESTGGPPDQVKHPPPPLTATHLAWKHVTTISHHLRASTEGPLDQVKQL